MTSATKKTGFWQRFLESFTVAAFAEAGEFNTAQKLAKEAGLEPQTELSFWEKAMAAVAFAEAGEFDTAREWLATKASEVEIRARHLEGLLETSVETAAATAFAEAGESYQAVQIIARLRGKRLLVVCEGAQLPEKLMRQGLELAEKMDLEMIVLNIFPHTMHARPSSGREKWRAEFRRRAEKALKGWRNGNSKVKITQMVEFGDPAEAIQHVLTKVKGVRYILSLKELTHAEEALTKAQVAHSYSWKH